MLCPSCDHDNIAGADQCDHCGIDLAGLEVGDWGIEPTDPQLQRPLREVGIKAPLVVRPDATVSDVLAKMCRAHEGCVFVQDEGRGLVGMISDHEVTSRLAAPGRDPAQTRAEEIMVHADVALRPDDPLAWALHRMGVDGHRHLPLTDEGRLVGFLSVRSVLAALQRTGDD